MLLECLCLLKSIVVKRCRVISEGRQPHLGNKKNACLHSDVLEPVSFRFGVHIFAIIRTNSLFPFLMIVFCSFIFLHYIHLRLQRHEAEAAETFTMTDHIREMTAKKF